MKDIDPKLHKTINQIEVNEALGFDDLDIKKMANISNKKQKMKYINVIKKKIHIRKIAS